MALKLQRLVPANLQARFSGLNFHLPKARTIAIPEHCPSVALTLPCRKAMFKEKAVVCWRFPWGYFDPAPVLPEYCRIYASSASALLADQAEPGQQAGTVRPRVKH